MKFVIDIPEETYKATCNGNMLPPDVKNVVDAIKNSKPLPRGYGRLVDADAITKDFNTFQMSFGINMSNRPMKIICNAPTIIEADEEQMDETNN